MPVSTLTIRRPDDFHVHLRQGKILRLVAALTAKNFARVLVMPNTRPHPILTIQDAAGYYQEIQRTLDPLAQDFCPLMTLQITPQTTPKIITEAAREGIVVACKLYPEGVTTNSDNGVSNFKDLYPVFGTMADCNLVLCLHGESPNHGVAGLNREAAFLPQLREIAIKFSGLRIVLEHITTFDAVQAVHSLPANVAATITAHHLVLTLDDVIGYSKQSQGKLSPHNFCKPIAKHEFDRQALCHAATSGNPKFFFGSDSAPHSISDKECVQACAGCFTAPVALPILADVFDRMNALDKLEDFVATHGSNFYNLTKELLVSDARITLVKESWKVPRIYIRNEDFPPSGSSNVIRPFLADETLAWHVV